MTGRFPKKTLYRKSIGHFLRWPSSSSSSNTERCSGGFTDCRAGKRSARCSWMCVFISNRFLVKVIGATLWPGSPFTRNARPHRPAFGNKHPMRRPVNQSYLTNGMNFYTSGAFAPVITKPPNYGHSWIKHPCSWVKFGKSLLFSLFAVPLHLRSLTYAPARPHLPNPRKPLRKHPPDGLPGQG